MFSFDGLISGIDSRTIIDGLTSLQQRQIDRFQVRQENIRNQQKSLQGLEARVLSLRASMGQLNRTTNNAFNSMRAQSSHENMITATVGNQAIEGSYNLRVISRATAHQVGSNGFAGSAEEITTGSISIQVGNRPLTEIQIDSGNNSVAGLVQAINRDSVEVSASLIHDQASGTDRILLTSRHTGTANQISIVNNLDEVPGITRPDFSGPAVQEAADASVQLGAGAGAIVSTFSTNQIDNLIQGVSLNLMSVDPNQDVLLSINRDSEPAVEAVREFVKQFNDVMSYINDQTRFDPATQTAGPLLGNRNVTDFKNQLLSMVTDSVPGLTGGLSRLSQIGVTLESNDRLVVNSNRLDRALNGQLDGVNPSQIRRLFGLTGSSTNSGIEFVLGSSRTRAQAVPYQVDLIQAAERATVSATRNLDEVTVINSSNNQFQISLDGITSETLTLAEGSYSRTELAAQLQSVINASSTLGNRSVAVAISGQTLKVTSNSYGSSSQVSSFSGSAVATLGFDGTEINNGRDVAGSFIVNGVAETAVGSGRILVGDSNNAYTADLQIRVTLNPNQVVDGVDGDLLISRGATAKLDQLIGTFLNPDTGAMGTINQRFDAQLESIQQSIDRINQITESKREFLTRQFATLERSLANLQTTSSIVASQLAGIQQ